METSFPGHVTTVNQEEPPRQMGLGEDRETSRTISAAFPPRSGFVQQVVQEGRAKSRAPLNLALSLNAL